MFSDQPCLRQTPLPSARLARDYNRIGRMIGDAQRSIRHGSCPSEAEPTAFRRLVSQHSLRPFGLLAPAVTVCLQIIRSQISPPQDLPKAVDLRL